MQWWFKKFFKREESLEDEDHSDQPSELDNDQLRAINGAELLITTWEVAKEKCRPFYGHWASEANWKGEKSQQVGASWTDQKSKKSSFWSIVFSYSTQQRTISQLDWDVWQKVDFIQQLVMTSSVVRPRRSSKALSQSQNWAKKRKVMVTVWWSAAHLTHYSLLNPGKIITPEKYAQWIDKMPPKLLSLASIDQQYDPNSSPRWCPTAHGTTNASKVEHIGLWSFASSAIFTWSLANWLPHFFKHLDSFLQGKHFHKLQEAENAFHEFMESKSMDFFMLQE